MKIKILLVTLLVVSTVSLGTVALAANNRERTNTKMNRVKVTEQRRQEIYGTEKIALAATDPDFEAKMHRFLLGEVYSYGNLTNRQRLLITIASITATGNADVLAPHVEAALRVGTKPEEIKEVFHQIAPYIGFPGAVKGLVVTNKVFKAQGIKLPLPSQSTTTEGNRLEKGIAVQSEIFGADNITKMRTAAPANQKHIQDYLSAYCFGDTYTRTSLDLKEREMLTLAAIASMGGCDPQVKAHVNGNKLVGNDKNTILAVITQCMPFIGFPKTLNALAAVNAVLPEAK